MEGESLGRKEREKQMYRVREEEERSQKVKRREESNQRCPYNRQKGRGHGVKTKGKETDKTKSLTDSSFS